MVLAGVRTNRESCCGTKESSIGRHGMILDQTLARSIGNRNVNARVRMRVHDPEQQLPSFVSQK